MTALAAMFCLSACSSEGEAQAQTTAGDSGQKTLVVYYSYTGNSRQIVEALQAQVNCDVVEVIPTEDLDYNANNYKIGSDQIDAINAAPNDAASYPSINDVEVDFSRYQFIVIAAPLWHSCMASNMQAFLFRHGREMAGRNIGLIVSSWSSSYTGPEQDAKRLIPDGVFTKTLWINHSNHSQRQTLVNDWLTEINYQSLMNTNDGQTRQIAVSDGQHTVTYQLNETSAAKALYDRLPLSVAVENYSTNEKIFYPQPALDPGTDNIEEAAVAGTLAFFSPWGNVVMFYGPASKYPGLYIMGKAISGADQISSLTGTIQVTKEGTTGISQARAKSEGGKSYRLNGQLAKVNDNGIIISNGKKHIVR